MIPALQWLLDLDDVMLTSGQPVSIAWQAPLARWLLFALGLLVAGVVVLSYRREPGSVAWRASLTILRLGALGMVIALACQPIIVLERNRVERSQVAVLVDTSASMQTRDGLSDASGAPRTRLAEIQQMLLEDDAGVIRAALKRHELRWATFAGVLAPSVTTESDGDIPRVSGMLSGLAADGERSHVLGAIDEVLSREASGRLAGIVLCSDGQSTEGFDPAETIARAVARAVPIYAVAVGSPVPRVDLVVEGATTDERLFRGDLLHVQATVHANGLTEPTTALARLIETDSGRELAAQPLRFESGERRGSVDFVVAFERDRSWSLSVVVDALAGEMDTANNRVDLAAAAASEPLRVLYVEGYPRYEYRYLKNTLLRESSISLSCLLLSADSGFAQEGDEPIRRFPATREELEQFDVLLIGDIDPHTPWITAAQWDLVARFVRERGGGIAFIAGARHGMAGWAGTPLGRICPVVISGVALDGAGRMSSGFHPRRTPEGARARLLRYTSDPQRNTDLFEALPPLYWSAATGGPKPGTETLLTRPGLQTTVEPLVVQGYFGAGRTLFQGTDDLWRWRRHLGELLYDAYYVQMVRHLAPTPSAKARRRMQLTCDPPRVQVGENARVQLRVPDVSLQTVLGGKATLVLRDAEGFVERRVAMTPVDEDGESFEVTLVAGMPGRYALEIGELGGASNLATQPWHWEVQPADLEARTPHADHGLLRRLAEGSGGRVLGSDEVEAALAALEDRSLQIPDDLREPLWDTKLALLLIGTLGAAEWIGRKWAGMV